MNYKIRNWDKETLTEQKNQIDNENALKLQNVKITPEEQKKFWFTIMLPCFLAFIMIIVVWAFITPHMTMFLKTLLRIAVIGVGAGIEINRVMELLSTSSLLSATLQTPYTEQIKFYNAIDGKINLTFETIELPDDTNESVFIVPKSLTSEDSDGKTSTYFFDHSIWKIRENDINEIYIDVGNLKIICPTKEIEAT